MTRRNKLAVAAAGAFVLAGTGAAFASGAGRHQPAPGFGQHAAAQERPGFGARGFPGARGFRFGLERPGLGGGLLQAAAGYLGVSASTLKGDLRSGQSLADVAGKTSGKSAGELVNVLVDQQKSRLDAAVTAGKLTQAQEDRITSNLQQRITELVNAKPPARGRGFGHPGAGGLLQAAAGYLGVPASTLADDLRSGKTLADVANSTDGKSADGLVTALVTQRKSQLDAAVAAGKLTQTQEDRITSNLRQRITALVDATRPAQPFPRERGFGFGGGHHGGRGMPPGSGTTT